MTSEDVEIRFMSSGAAPPAKMTRPSLAMGSVSTAEVDHFPQTSPVWLRLLRDQRVGTNDGKSDEQKADGAVPVEERERRLTDRKVEQTGQRTWWISSKTWTSSSLFLEEE